MHSQVIELKDENKNTINNASKEVTIYVNVAVKEAKLKEW